jgi:hypothetical protein
MCREVPYDGLDPIDIKSKVEKDEPLKNCGNATLNQLITECRQSNMQERPTFDRILEILNYMSK